MTAEPRVLERLSRVSPFGVRFHDPLSGAVVTDGLRVHVYSPERPDRRIEALPNRSGTFVAARLAGAPNPAVEFGDGDNATWAAGRPYVVEVVDRNGQFLPFTFDTLLPALGFVMPSCAVSSPPSMVTPLFPAPARRVASGTGVIRADLRFPVATAARTEWRPASWAVLEARVAGSPPARGIADAEGRVVVMLPYPEPARRPARPASPPFPGGSPLASQEWTVTLDAFFEPPSPVPAIPNLCRTLDQAPAVLWADERQERPLADQILRYGSELVVRGEGTGDGSVVVITPLGSPP
jgi:hypothetical protein